MLEWLSLLLQQPISATTRTDLWPISAPKPTTIFNVKSRYIPQKTVWLESRAISALYVTYLVSHSYPSRIHLHSHEQYSVT